MAETFSFHYFGSTIHAQSLGVGSVPSVEETLSSHCVPFISNGEMVVVNVIGRGIDIPGGHIDENETAIEAIQRESWEEAKIKIKNPVLVDVWHLSSPDGKLGLRQKPYLLLYSAEVETMEHFTPNNEVDHRYILTPDQFIAEYFGDKNQAKIIVDKALSQRGSF